MHAGIDLLVAVLLFATPSVAPGPIAYVIDRSSSMTPRMAHAKLAGEGLIASVDAGAQVLLYTFNDSVTALTPAPVPIESGPAGHIKRRELIDAIRAIRPSGGTNILQAMDDVIAAGATTIILLTDGQQTATYQGVPGNQVAIPDAVAAQVSRARPGLRVFPIGVGADVDVSILEQYATQTDGAFFLVMDSKDLLSVFSQICRIIGGKLVSDGPAVTVFPGDDALTVFVALPGGTPSDSVSLQGVSRHIALRSSDELFTARVGEVCIFKFDVCPPPGAYKIVAEGNAAIRVLTEKRAPFRLQLDPIGEAKRNRPLVVKARVVRLINDATLPRKGELVCRLSFDRGDERQAATVAGPFAMEQVSETELRWSGWLAETTNPAGTYNARLVAEMSGWTTDCAVAFVVEGSVPWVEVSSPKSGKLAGPLELGPVYPGEAVEVPLHLEWRDWPSEQSLSVGRGDDGEPFLIPAGTPAWPLRFRAPAEPGRHSVRWRFFAKEALINDASETWYLDVAVNVKPREIRVAFPQGRDLGALPGTTRIHIVAPDGLAPTILHVTPSCTVGDLLVKVSSPKGMLESWALALEPGENVFSIEFRPSPSCPPGAVACDLVFRPDERDVRLCVDGKFTDRARLSGTVDVWRVSVGFAVQADTGIEEEGETIKVVRLPTPRTLTWAIALSPDDSELAEGLIIDCHVPGPGWDASIERRDQGLFLRVSLPLSVTQGPYRLPVTVGHKLARVKPEPSELSLFLEVRNPRVRISLHTDSGPLGPEFSFWQSLRACLSAKYPILRDDLRIRLRSLEADGLPVCVGHPVVGPPGVASETRRDRHALGAGAPLFAGRLPIGADEEVSLGALCFPGPGRWSVLVPVSSELAFEPDLEPLVWDPRGAIVISTTVRRFPFVQLLAAVGVLFLSTAIALFRRHMRRNPHAQLSLALVDGPEDSWIANEGVRQQKCGEPLIVKGRLFSRRTIQIGPGGNVTLGGANSPRANVCIRRKRGVYFVETLRGTEADVQLVHRGAARAAHGAQLDDGDELRIGEFRILVKVPTRIQRRPDVRRIQREELGLSRPSERMRARRIPRILPG